MFHRPTTLGRLATILALGGSALIAQGVQTGTLTITVRDASGAPLANVRVDLKSDKLAGGRSGMTDAAGVYRAPLLPPGNYTATVSKDGFRSAGVSAVVPLGGATTAEVSLKTMQTEGAVVTVTATSSKVDKTEVSARENFIQEDILKLPVGRTLAGITQLAPGVTTGAGGRAVVGGAATYENKFLVNGADVADNYFNSDVGLFIEDAIDETQVLLNNVSAEYGRFTGGVVNAITKRGGNEFEGSLRATLTNNDWNAIRPLENRANIVDKINTVYTFTFGGPILKDKLWFFVAGRSVKASNTLTLPFSGYQYTQKDEETRIEANLTWQITADHRVTGAYMKRDVENKNRRPLVNNTADLAGLSNRKDPLSLMTIAYDGILTPSLNLNVMYTQKKQAITSSSIGAPGNNGGTAFWQSPVFDAFGALFNNHYFGNDGEDRDNNSIKATLSYYFTAAGNHELKFGWEQFKEINQGTNKQSPTGYNIDADEANYPLNTYGPITYNFYSLDDGGFPYLEDWTTAPGGKFTSTYNSLFVNDNWTLNNHWNMSVGLRYEKWQGDKNPNAPRASFSDIVPRVGINYDPKGDGSWQFSASYAQYAGKANAAIVTANTYVGNPAVRLYVYTGPTALNVTPGPNAPGFRRSDYDSVPFYVSDATKNVILDKDFKAPLTIEFTTGLKHKVSDRTNLTMLFIYRNQTRMFEDYQGDEGVVDIEGTPTSIIRWGNVTDDQADRVYRALQTTWESSADFFGGKLFVRGNLTLSRLDGNYEGDGGNSPGGGTAIGNYEKTRPDAVAYGRLNNDEPVRVKTQALWSRPIGKNTLALGFNFDYASGKPYSLTNSRRDLDNAGYADSAGSYTRFYGRRGSGRFNDVYGLDFSAQWDGKIGPATGATSRLGYFIKLTAFNVLNNIQQATWDTRAAGNNVAWAPRSTFGKPTVPTNFVGNRIMQLDLGFRF